MSQCFYTIATSMEAVDMYLTRAYVDLERMERSCTMAMPAHQITRLLTMEICGMNIVVYFLVCFLLILFPPVCLIWVLSTTVLLQTSPVRSL